MHIGSYSFDDFLQLVESFHGHVAPGVVLGGIMVEAARRQLASEGLFDAICETRNCLPDAIQLLTPCTIGNGWLKVVNVGRYALTLYDKYAGTGVRVFLDPLKTADWPEINNWYLKLTPKKAQDSARLLAQIREAGPRNPGMAAGPGPAGSSRQAPAGRHSHLPLVPGGLSGPGRRHLPGLPGGAPLCDGGRPGRDREGRPAAASAAGGAGRGAPGPA